MTLRPTASGWFEAALPGVDSRPHFATLDGAKGYVEANWTLRGLVVKDTVDAAGEIREYVNRTGITHRDATSIIEQLMGGK